MIQVIATIELKPGCRDNFLPVLNEILFTMSYEL
jgi:quinol monooxygenase YgiN